jgi:hypothetical protein
VRPVLPQGNPPQNSNRLCPGLAVGMMLLIRLLPAGILKRLKFYTGEVKTLARGAAKVKHGGSPLSRT